MATYAIGDIQGCFTALQQLLAGIDFNPQQDRLWLAGDLVNRGPQSLEVLRWAMELDDRVVVVLGNHDLNLLALAVGGGKSSKRDTLTEIFKAPDRERLLTWLRQQKLFHVGEGYAMVHAGLLPNWTVAHAHRLAQEVEWALQDRHYAQFLCDLYGSAPKRWRDNLEGIERLRVVVNAMTRMRLLSRDGAMDLSFKGELKDAPADLLPWFAAPGRLSSDIPLVCGHWSALGLHMQENILAIDTGCLWGKALTAVRLEDRQVFQLSCCGLPGTVTGGD